MSDKLVVEEDWKTKAAEELMKRTTWSIMYGDVEENRINATRQMLIEALKKGEEHGIQFAGVSQAWIDKAIEKARQEGYIEPTQFMLITPEECELCKQANKEIGMMCNFHHLIKWSKQDGYNQAKKDILEKLGMMKMLIICIVRQSSKQDNL